MGGGKSKPVTESARQVLARSKEAGASSSGAVSAPSVSPSIFASSNMRLQERKVLAQASAVGADGKSGHQMEDFMDSKILKEMSSWQTVKSGVDEDALKLRTRNDSMATVIRFREEERLQDRFGQLPKSVVGKLTEDQIASMFMRVRQGKTADADLAQEYSLPPESVKAILRTARAPMLVSKGPNDKINDVIMAH